MFLNEFFSIKKYILKKIRVKNGFFYEKIASETYRDPSINFHSKNRTPVRKWLFHQPKTLPRGKFYLKNTIPTLKRHGFFKKPIFLQLYHFFACSDLFYTLFKGREVKIGVRYPKKFF